MVKFQIQIVFQTSQSTECMSKEEKEKVRDDIIKANEI